MTDRTAAAAVELQATLAALRYEIETLERNGLAIAACHISHAIELIVTRLERGPTRQGER